MLLDQRLESGDYAKSIRSLPNRNTWPELVNARGADREQANKRPFIDNVLSVLPIKLQFNAVYNIPIIKCLDLKYFLVTSTFWCFLLRYCPCPELKCDPIPLRCLLHCCFVGLLHPPCLIHNPQVQRHTR